MYLMRHKVKCTNSILTISIKIHIAPEKIAFEVKELDIKLCTIHMYLLSLKNATRMIPTKLNERIKNKHII